MSVLEHIIEKMQLVSILIRFSIKGSPDIAVKLLPCDHRVMGSSPGNSLLQKCSEKLRMLEYESCNQVVTITELESNSVMS
jgi:hypothetical protein